MVAITRTQRNKSSTFEYFEKRRNAYGSRNRSPLFQVLRKVSTVYSP